MGDESIWGVWYLMGAALVFFMQCGFAMVETGFTRAKNAGNIIMKNLMDFCIGTPMFMFLGFALMMSENYFFGLIGKPSLQLFSNYENFPWSQFVFNLVFCATAATIVSGSMAERTKFSAYCIYSAVISAVVYPIEAGRFPIRLACKIGLLRLCRLCGNTHSRRHRCVNRRHFLGTAHWKVHAQ